MLITADDLRVLLSIVLVNLFLHTDIVTNRNVAVAEEDFDATLLKCALMISCILIIKFGRGLVFSHPRHLFKLRCLILRVLVVKQLATWTETLRSFHMSVALLVLFGIVDRAAALEGL